MHSQSNHPQSEASSHTEKRHEGERLLTRKLRWSKFAILLERLWLRLWAPASVIAIFVIVSLFGLWSYLNPLAHRLLLAVFLFALVGALIPLLSLRWPRDAEALRRLDKNSTLPHQPAQAFRDHLGPAMEQSSTRAIWLQFKERLVEKILNLRVSPPRPNTASKDPYALRALLLLTLVAGLFFQAGNIGTLFNKAFALPPMTDTKSLRIDAWVTPPDYTGHPPILIADGGRNETPGEPPRTSFKVPENSTLTIRVNGSNISRVAVKTVNEAVKKPTSQAANRLPANQKAPAEDNPGQQKAANKTNSDKNKKSREFQISLKKDGPLQLTLDEIPLKDWTFTIIEDMPPIIGLIEMPVKAQSGALKLKYRLADDYGIIRAKSRIDNVTFDGIDSAAETDEDRRPLGDPPEFPLNLPQLVTKEGKAETFKDLTSHPWAGLTGDLYLIAEDEGGNESKSPHIKLLIPETEFTKPMAKNIIRLRKQLIIAPYESRLVARSISSLKRDKKPFEKDLTLYLGLAIAANRLDSAETRREKEDVASLLYDLARHVEDGDLSAAERELRTAQEALRKALEQNAPASELQKRIDELRKALQKYMQALAKQQEKQNAQNNQNQQDQNGQDVNPQDFEQMLKTIEELAKSGSKDLAKQMLSQMQNMLENLETGKNNNRDQQNQTAKDLEELGKILREQQKLMDETYQERRQSQQQNRERMRQQQQGDRPSQQQGQRGGKQQPGQKGRQQMGQNGQQSQQGQSLEQQQQSLQEKLKQLMDQMRRQQGGKGQQSLDNARDAMGRAQQQLKGDNLGEALTEEGQALDQLRRGMEQMARQMQKGQPGKGGGKRTGGRDPLGRPGSPSGLDTSESTKVPDEIEIQRAREILRNLQDKLSDPNRPAPEIDYFERLLKRFN